MRSPPEMISASSGCVLHKRLLGLLNRPAKVASERTARRLGGKSKEVVVATGILQQTRSRLIVPSSPLIGCDSSSAYVALGKQIPS